MSGLEKKVKWRKVWREHGKPLEFYCERYPLLGREQLRKVDYGLYQRLYNDGLIKDVPLIVEPLEKKVRWGDVWREHGKPLEFYHEHYWRLSRGQLAKEDSSLYQRLRSDGLIKEVPLIKPKRTIIPRDFAEDPLAYYKKHYPGLTRGQLEKENAPLYQRLWRDDLLDDVPLTNKPREFGKDLVAYYRKHHDGATRAELQKVDAYLYQCMRKAGKLDHIPLVKTGPKTKYGDDLLAYYHEHFPGLTRRQLKKTAGHLYNLLREGGLIEQVPLKQGGQPVEQKDFGDDPLVYYFEHHEGLTQNELAQVDELLYNRLRRDRLLKHVPLQKKK